MAKRNGVQDVLLGKAVFPKTYEAFDVELEEGKKES
jgi:hypothetical protein